MQLNTVLLVATVLLISIQACFGQYQVSTTYTDNNCTTSIGLSIVYNSTCAPSDCTEFEQSPGQFYKVECFTFQPNISTSWTTLAWSNDNCATQPALVIGVEPERCVTVADFFYSVEVSKCVADTAYDISTTQNCSRSATQTTSIARSDSKCYSLVDDPTVYFFGLCPTAKEPMPETPYYFAPLNVNPPITVNNPTSKQTSGSAGTFSITIIAFMVAVLSVVL